MKTGVRFFLFAGMLFILIFLHLTVKNILPNVYFQEMVVFPWLVHSGLQLYKDVIITYPPGLPNILLPLYRLSGFTFDSLSNIQTGFLILTDILLFIISYKLFRSVIRAVCVILFYILWYPITEGYVFWFETACNPFLLVSLYFFIRYIGNDRKSILISGLAMALVLVIKQTFLWVYVLMVLFVIVRGILLRSKSLLKDTVYILIFPVISMIAVSVHMVLNGLFREYWYWTIIFPLTNLSHNAKFILIPTMYEIRQFIPAYALIVISITLMIWGRYKGRKAEVCAWIMFVLGSACTVLPRWGYFHLQSSVLLLSLGTGYMYQEISSVTRSRILTGIIICMVLYTGLLTYQSQKHFYLDRMPKILSYNKSESEAVRVFLSKHIGEKDFFSFENMFLVYFIMNRKPSVIPWIQFLPAMDDADIQKTLTGVLEKKKPPYVVYQPTIRGKTIGSDTIPDIIQSYIASHYRTSDMTLSNPPTYILIRK